jgi:integrase
MGRKKCKGEVSLYSDKGKIRLRWRLNSKRYSLNLSWICTRTNIITAKKIVQFIEHDIDNNKFDTSLQKYNALKLSLSTNTHTTSAAGKIPEATSSRNQHLSDPSTIIMTAQPNHVAGKEKVGINIITLFELWTTQYRNRSCDQDVDYCQTKRMLARWKISSLDEALIKLQNEKFSESMYNRRLSMLKQFFDWLVKKKYTSDSPLGDVTRKRRKQKEVRTHKPFTVEETTKILHAFKTDQFVHPFSSYTHSHYYQFVYFLFSTGARNAEAVGLRVQDVDVTHNRLKIERALARTLRGTHPKARIEKETKNGKVRYIPLSPELKEVLLPLLINKQPTNLVFTSVNGLCIDDRMFTKRVFKPVLKALNIEYRTLYACRHGFSSRLLAAGVNPVTTAFLLGNNPETALRYYTHLLELPATLPPVY